MKYFPILPASFNRLACGLFLFLLFSFMPACGQHDADSVKSKLTHAGIETKPDPTLIIGSYTQYKVVDGDTFHVLDLERGVRFLCIDTEEVPRGQNAAQELAQLRSRWPEQYYTKAEGKRFPVKTASPFGFDTAEWAKRWFRDVDSIRLERDSRDNVYGYFGRYLAYVFAKKNGTWMNYNVECVRLGYSPYSMKYGYSTRFHDAFTSAQQEARQNNRGIWNDEIQHYPQYAERLQWWTSRAESIAEFLRLRKEHSSLYFIGRDGEYERLSLAAGKKVCVFAALGRVPEGNTVQWIDVSHKNKVSLQVQLPPDLDIRALREQEQQYIWVQGIVKSAGEQLHVFPATAADISRLPCF